MRTYIIADASRSKSSANTVRANNVWSSSVGSAEHLALSVSSIARSISARSEVAFATKDRRKARMNIVLPPTHRSSRRCSNRAYNASYSRSAGSRDKDSHGTSRCTIGTPSSRGSEAHTG